MPAPVVLALSAGVVGLSSAALAQCAGTTPDWAAPFEGPLGQPALDNTAGALCSWDPDGDGPLLPRLVVGGVFVNAGGTVVNRIAQWDGSSWQGFGSGLTIAGIPSVTMSWDPDGAGPSSPRMLLGGFFTAVGGVAARNIASWNGTAWSPLASGTADSQGFPDVYASTMWDPDGAGPLGEQLVIAGDFTVAGGVSCRRIARWDGTTWQPFGTGMTDSVFCVTTWDADGDGPQAAQVIAGGFFGIAGGQSASRIARWDGAAWRNMGAGFTGEVEAVKSWDPDGVGPLPPTLVAGGVFVNSGAASVKRIARWDGAAWQQLGGGFDSGRVFSLTTFDLDGDGPAVPELVAGGAFTTSGGATVNNIAHWDGTQWRGFGAGLNSQAFEVTTWDADGPGPRAPDLVAAGIFTTAGSVSAGRIALWPAAVPACSADLTCDGGVDGDDVIAFFGFWDAGLDAADFNRDGGVDGDDVIAFFGHWDAGC